MKFQTTTIAYKQSSNKSNRRRRVTREELQKALKDTIGGGGGVIDGYHQLELLESSSEGKSKKNRDNVIYNDVLDVFVDEFHQNDDPDGRAKGKGLNGGDTDSSSSGIYDDSVNQDIHRHHQQQQQRQQSGFDHYFRVFLGWPTRPILVRKKGVVVGAYADEEGIDDIDVCDENLNNINLSKKNRQHRRHLVGAMTLVPSTKRTTFTLWDILSNIYHLGNPIIVDDNVKEEEENGKRRNNPVKKKKKKKVQRQSIKKRFNQFSVVGKKKEEYVSSKKGSSERYISIPAIGVKTEYHGMGYGGALLRTATSVADDLNAYLYLETSSQANVCLYEHYGFNVVDFVDFPTTSSIKNQESIKKRGRQEEDDDDDNYDEKSTLTLYLMIRDPKSFAELK